LLICRFSIELKGKITDCYRQARLKERKGRKEGRRKKERKKERKKKNSDFL
jgi:hypothetical protein